jgi:hypothetical protein
MSLLIECPSCGSRFKAPDVAAGRTVKCLACRSPIAVPVLPPPVGPTEVSKESKNHVAAREAAVAQPEPIHAARSALLMPLLLVGAVVAFLLVVVLFFVAVGIPRSPHVAFEPTAHDPAHEENNDADPPAPSPREAEKPPPAPRANRAERLAELEAEEKTVLALFEQQHDKSKQAIQRLRKEEDSLFPKTKLKAALPAQLPVRYAMFIKEMAAVVRQVNKNTLTLQREREQYVQARRKILIEQPEPGDPKLEAYGSLLLTEDEIRDLGKQSLTFGSPRAAAQRHIGAAEAADTVTRPLYAGTYQDPEDADVAAVSYRVAGYRGKTGADIQVHVFVHRARGAWSVLELPGRPNSVLFGPPPAEYKRTDSPL